MYSLSIQTLGCKLNQVESEAIASAFKTQGFLVIPPEFPQADGAEIPSEYPPDLSADILVVNTCTVTSKAEQKARRIIRKALREHPSACIVVTGCYAQLDGPKISALAGDMPGGSGNSGEASDGVSNGAFERLFVVTGDCKAALLDLPRYLIASANVLEAVAAWYQDWNLGSPGVPRNLDPFAFTVEDFSFHSRAFLKIQDGCDHRCAYCRVSLARGKSVSLDGLTLLSRLQALEERGYGEAVLTGVNITQYRAPIRIGDTEQLALGELLDFLLRETGRIALRLSSLEIEGMSPAFLEVLPNRRIRPHFHLSLQSGSNRILERMRRWYTSYYIEETIKLLRSCKDDPFLACDIITGFPGETAEEFEKTRELCQRTGFAWIHVFPYSKRPGTEAFMFKDQVSEGVARSRLDTLIALARQGRAAYSSRWIGKTVEAITETPYQAPPGYSVALSENYLRLLIPNSGAALTPGRSILCRLHPLPESSLRSAITFDALGDPAISPEVSAS